MPRYHYRCEKCAHEFEKRQSMTEEPVKICPVCQGQTSRIISSNVGIAFKGTGFHINDYKSKKSDVAPLAKPSKDSGTTGAKTS
ncbi:MAG: zinc ribbon domain-containing protein [Candidatus Margulisbacteria bacterium]|nr:zinc ribbon domain-containing protein [Candidatus Margulisiibacteriota bacterium]